MKCTGHKRPRVLLLLLATLLLRVSIPVGYMPAAAGSGLLFELCPEGLPAAVMQALAPRYHHHHSSSDEDHASFDAERCPVGHMLSSAIAVDCGQAADVSPELPVFYSPDAYAYWQPARIAYHSRAPPAEELS